MAGLHRNGWPIWTGKRTQKTDKVTGDFTTYEYDAENKLIRVVSSSGTTGNYKYDGLGRRVEKEVTEAGLTNITRFIYDNEDILLELDGSNNIVARYTHGPGIDEPLITERGGQSFFYHADGLGSVTELTDSVGTLAQSYTYSSFGKIESQLDLNFVQPYTFTSREFDPESGLYHYRARYYDPALGRFMQEDPLGFLAEINFYTYASANPIGRTDPLGLDALQSASDFSAGAGDFLSGGFMNSFGLSESLFGHRAIPITQFARQLLGSDEVVNQCSGAYTAGQYTGVGIMAGLVWTAGLNGGANSVFWSGYNQGAQTAAQAFGTTLESTPIGGLLNLVSNHIFQVPRPIWVAASATFAGNASGTAQAVIRSAGEIWSRVEYPILLWRNVPIIFR